MDLDKGGVSVAIPAGQAMPWKPTADTPGRIASVQMLRFLAAFVVLAHHAEGAAYHLGRYRGVELARPWFNMAGAFGVDLFFAISGFIMIVSSDKLYGRPGARASFVRRRLIRIMPLYWLITAFALAWTLRIGGPVEVPGLLYSLMFYPWSPDPSHIGVSVLVPVAWTLYFEMEFYLIFAACLGNGAWQSAARASGIIAVLTGLGLLLAPPMPWAYWTSPIIAEFIGGMAVALLWQRGLRLPAPLRLAMLLVACVLVLGNLPEPGVPALDWSRTLSWGTAGLLILAATVLGPMRLIGERGWNVGGDVSYALYLVHMPLLAIAQFLWRHFKLPFGAWQEGLFVTVTIAGSFVAAVILHRAVERRITRWLNRALAPAPSVQPA